MSPIRREFVCMKSWPRFCRARIPHNILFLSCFKSSTKLTNSSHLLSLIIDLPQWPSWMFWKIQNAHLKYFLHVTFFDRFVLCFFSLSFLVIIIQPEIDTLIMIVNILHSKFSFFVLFCVVQKAYFFFCCSAYLCWFGKNVESQKTILCKK